MGCTLVIVGLGNIGSHLVPLLARIPEVTRLVLVDKGRYDRTNLRTQAIAPGEVGRSKARVQGLLLKRIRPALDVTAVDRAVETVPLGRLRADAILACVDSRAARQYLNQAARRLGVPLIDAGVLPDGHLARVSVFVPGGDHACLECTWDQADYDAIERTFPCLGGAPDAASTGAPAHLGSLAAAIQALECQSLLDGRTALVGGSYEIVVDAASRRQHVTRFARNTSCRLAEHEPWEIRRLSKAPEHMTVRQALALGSTRGSRRDTRLSFDGIPFVAGLQCLGCGRHTPVLRLRRAIRDEARHCSSCGGRLIASGADVVPSLTVDGLSLAAQSRSLQSLGFEAGDVFAVRRGERTRYFELDGRRVCAGRR
jgi:molybdopterin/thiamine biosynthesis adenylyltransferase